MPAFRAVWIAVLITNIGGWVASVATAWLMTSLDPSPLTVSLVSVATNFPLFLFALPAGALADIVDRRTLLILAQVFMLALTVLLLVLTVSGMIAPLTLLMLIFLIEAGTAFETPAYLALLPGLVPRQQLQPALALNGVGINISRIVGPALGGLVIGTLGVAAALLINALSFTAVIFTYARLAPTPPETCLPAERFVSAMRTGLRFARESTELKATLVRATAYFLFASAYLALLPLIARQQLDAGAWGFGVLFGCHGAGAVVGAFLLPYVRSRLGANELMVGGGVVVGIMTALLAVTTQIIVALPIVLFMGIGSLLIMSSLMLSAQLALPAWVKARGLAVAQMVFSGALSFGSLVWGIVGDRLGIASTLVLAAAGLAAASLLVRPWQLGQENVDHTPSQHWPDPIVAGNIPGDSGPVMVLVEYRVDIAQSAAFTQSLERLGRARRRDGALFWGHFTDTADPRRHIETFVAETWTEHLRQHERVTLADRALEDEVRAFQVEGKSPVVTHLVSARAGV